MIEKRLFHSQQLIVLVPISSTVSLFSSFFFFPSPFFLLFLQPLEKHRRFLADTKPDVYALLAHMVAKPSLDASLMSTGFHVGNFD